MSQVRLHISTSISAEEMIVSFCEVVPRTNYKIRLERLDRIWIVGKYVVGLVLRPLRPWSGLLHLRSRDDRDCGRALNGKGMASCVIKENERYVFITLCSSICPSRSRSEKGAHMRSW